MMSGDEATIAELREALKIARQRGVEEERARCVSCCRRLAIRARELGYDTRADAYHVAADEIERGE
jgi:hypothetical protein